MSQTYPYTREKADGAWNLTPANLGPAVEAAFPGNALQLQCSDTEVKIVLENEVDKPTLDNVVADTKAAFDPVHGARAAKIKELRDNTDVLIDQGAVYNGKTYMSTEQGRFDVLGIYAVGVLGATPGFFPKKVSTTDGNIETEFADAAAFAPFFAQMMGTYAHWKETGQVLRQAALDATTVAEVNAVTDDRTWPWAP